MPPLTPTPEQSSYRTRLGEVLGSKEQVKELDRLKDKVKSAPRDKYLYNRYMNSLAIIQTNVLSQKCILEKDLKKWEKEYFIKNNFQSPMWTNTMSDVNAKHLIKRIKCAKALLKSLNINI